MLGENFLFVRGYNLQRLQSKQEELAEEEQIEAAAKDGHHERSDEENSIKKEALDARNRLWAAQLLAKDCEKAWTHTGWEDTMQKWYEWLEHVKKKDEKGKMEDLHQRKVEKDDQECRR